MPHRTNHGNRAFTSSLAAALVALAPAAFAPEASAQTDTSTGAARMPEDGGPLPRADMPQGGAGTDVRLPRAQPPAGGAGTDDALPRAQMPQGGVDDRAPKVAPDVAPGVVPDGAREAAADGSAHGPRVPTAGEERLAETPAETAAGRGRAGPATQRVKGSFGDNAADIPGDKGVGVSWVGYVRMAAEATENDPRSTFVGRNDGFKLFNARLGLLANKGDFMGFISMEAAAGDRESFNDPNAVFAVRPRDAFLRYALSDLAHVTVGRFKAPYDISELENVAYRPFIDQSLESRGVLPTQGFETFGMSQGRQLGVMIHSDHLGLSDHGFDLGYAIALTNGRTMNLLFNDNDRLAAFARLTAFWGKVVQLNVAGFSDSRTVGVLPNLFDETVRGLEVSSVVAIAGLRLEAQLLLQNTTFDTTGLPDVNSIGWHAQWSYELWGFLVGYRFAWYDPNTRDLENADRIMEHTIGVGYTLEELPVRILVNGTVVVEQEGRRLDNNRLTAMAQYTF